MKSNSHQVRNMSSDYYWIFALAVFYIVMYGYLFDQKIDLNGDNMGYLAMGKNISLGKGFSYAYDISASRVNEPVGYPILIAPIMLISDEMNLLSLQNGLFMLASLILLVCIGRTLALPKTVWILSALFFIVNPLLMKYAYIHMSEAPYLFFSLLGIYLLLILKADKPFEKQKTFYLMAIVLLFMYFTRTAGIILLISVILYLIYAKKFIASMILAGLFIVFIGAWTQSAPSSNRYIQVVLQINPYDPSLGKLTPRLALQRVLKNLNRYAGKEIPSATFPFLDIAQNKPPKAIHYLIGISVAIFTLIGLWFKFPKQPARLMVFFYLTGSIVMLLMWPEQWFGPRFIIPLVPLIIFFGIKGLTESTTWIGNKFQKTQVAILPWALLLTLPLFFGVKSGNRIGINTIRGAHQSAKAKYPAAYQNFFNLGSWAKKNLPRNSVVASRKPTLFYYSFKGYTCYYPTTAKTTVEFLNGLKNSRATHLVMEELGYKTTPYLTFFINNLPQNFQLVHTIPGPETRIYRILY